MGFVSSILGTAGGAAGTGFAAPASANILNPTTTAQANTAYTGNQNALTQQQNFLNAVTAQNGLGNQSQVYNQLQGVANGTGPNLAQAMLNQATGQNIAAQSALMAGQRGSGANAGLLARQAAQQGAATQQQAVGQSATMQANQSLNAISAAGQMANQQANQQAAATTANTTAQQNEQQNLLNSIAQQNNANVGMQSNINNANANLASGQMAAQNNLLGNITGGIGSALGLANGGRVMAANGLYASTTNDNFDTASASPMTQAHSTSVMPTVATTLTAATASTGPKSTIGQHLNSSSTSSPKLTGTAQIGNTIGSAIGAGINALFGSSSSSTPPPTQPNYNSNDASMYGVSPQTMQSQYGDSSMYGVSNNNSQPSSQYAKGGKVPALVSPGEIRVKAKDVPKVMAGKKSPMEGEKIKGKPKVGGAVNSYANDTVPKTLNEGDIILPRSVTQAKHPHWAAHKFMQDVMSGKHRKK